MYLIISSPVPNSRRSGLRIGIPVLCDSSAYFQRYGRSDFLRFVKNSATLHASSSNAHGTLYEELPCSLECDERSPNATYLLKRSGEVVSSNPPISWLQNPKPDRARERPPLRVDAIDE